MIVTFTIISKKSEQFHSGMTKFTCMKQFEIENLEVPGAQIIRSPVYGDVRGNLYESFHILKVDYTTSIDEINGIYPGKNTLYGPVAHTGEELLYLIRGKLLVHLVDFNDHSKRARIEVEPGMVIRIPSNCIHAFYSLDETTIFDLVKTTSHVEEHYFSAEELGLVFPGPIVAAPHQDNKPLNVDYAIMGANGMIGSAFVRDIEARGQTWVQLRSRLNQQEGLENELRHIMPKVSVIIAAGVGTRPNTKWCEDHHIETIDANVTAQLAAVRICKKLGLHCTIIGTSGFYHSESETSKPFAEEDAPNHECNYYYQMRVLEEKLLKDTGLDKHCLNLRALFPFDHKLTTSSLVGKLLRFKVINSIKTSVTVLPSLVPLALEMMEKKITGPVNWNCRGTLSNGDILRAYAEVVDPAFTFNEQVLSYEQSKANGNSAANVEPKRLIEIFGDRVPEVHDAVKHVMELIKAEKK